MKIRILALLLGFSFFLSCNINDNPIQNETIIGIWNLKNVSGGFPGVDIDYENVFWQFVSETNVLIVESSLISNDPQSAYLPLQSGNYNYSLTELNGKTFIIIEDFGIYENEEYGRYEINDNNLMIDQGEGSEASASDVFILQFER